MARDFANKKAFNTTQYPPPFPKNAFLYYRSTIFFKTIIEKRKGYLLIKLDIKDICC